MRTPIPAIAVLLLLGACAAQTAQTTSGAEYLARYQPVKPEPQPVVQRTVHRVDGKPAIFEERVATVGTDELIRQAAAIEPLLRLPARVGLARIDGGRLTTIPAGESAVWMALVERHAELGTFTPIDPFLAEYTMLTVLPQDQRALRRDASDIVTRIRLGAARQHADAVLIYEVGARQRRVEGIDGLAPVGVLGMAPLPATPIEKEGVARAFLMDVRNGYPYGAASASVDLGPVARSFWASGPEDSQGIEAKIRITRGLAPEVEAMLTELTRQMRTRLAVAN